MFHFSIFFFLLYKYLRCFVCAEQDVLVVSIKRKTLGAVNQRTLCVTSSVCPDHINNLLNASLPKFHIVEASGLLMAITHIINAGTRNNASHSLAPVCALMQVCV